MPDSTESPLSTDSFVKLLIALLLLSFLIALFQSDTTVAAIRRAVRNIVALPLLLVMDMSAGVNLMLNSGHVKMISAMIQACHLKITGVIGETIASMIRHLDAARKIQTHLLAIHITIIGYIDTFHIIAGRVKRLVAITYALFSIVFDAVIDYIRVSRADRSLSDDAYYVCTYICHTIISLVSLLFAISKVLGGLIHNHLTSFAVYASFMDSVSRTPGLFLHHINSSWVGLCDGMNQQFTTMLDLIFGDRSAVNSPDSESITQTTALDSSTPGELASASQYQSPWKGRLRARNSSV